MFSLRQNTVSNITGKDGNNIKNLPKAFIPDLLGGRTLLHEAS